MRAGGKRKASLGGRRGQSGHQIGLAVLLDVAGVLLPFMRFQNVFWNRLKKSLKKMPVTVPMITFLNVWLVNVSCLPSAEVISLLSKEHIFSTLPMPTGPTWHVFSNLFLGLITSLVLLQRFSPPFTFIEASV